MTYSKSIVLSSETQEAIDSKHESMCCVVFGGTKGIGAAISHLFIRDGFNVAVISRNQHHVDRILSTIDETHLSKFLLV